jgi:hypothetical protein
MKYLGTVLLVILMFSCSEKKSGQSDLTSKQIAYHHNAALDFAYSKVKKNYSMDALINSLGDYLFEEGLAERSVIDMEIEKAKKFYYKHKKSKKSLLETGIFTDSFRTILNNGQISQELFDDFLFITTDKTLLSDEVALLDFLNTTFISKDWSDSDRIYVDIFVDVCNSSAAYWSMPVDGKKQLKCSTKVIINDAIGGVIGGLATGGIGSVVLAGILSAGSNEDC